MRTFLVAVVAHEEKDVHDFLLASRLGPAHEDSLIDCWWMAEDDRQDGSDCDSAIFVPRGSQSDFAQMVRTWFEENADRMREDGYDYAGTDVSGGWFQYADCPECQQSTSYDDLINFSTGRVIPTTVPSGLAVNIHEHIYACRWCHAKAGRTA